MTSQRDSEEAQQVKDHAGPVTGGGTAVEPLGFVQHKDAQGRNCRSDGRSCFAFVMKREDAIRLLGELTAWLGSGKGNFVCSPMIRDSVGGTFEMWTSGIPAEARVSGKLLLLFEASGVAGDRESWFFPSRWESLWGDCASDAKPEIDPERSYDLTDISGVDDRKLVRKLVPLWSIFDAWLSEVEQPLWGGSPLPDLVKAVDTEWTRWKP